MQETLFAVPYTNRAGRAGAGRSLSYQININESSILFIR